MAAQAQKQNTELFRHQARNISVLELRAFTLAE
jgi:hypothetical protein